MRKLRLKDLKDLVEPVFYPESVLRLHLCSAQLGWEKAGSNGDMRCMQLPLTTAYERNPDDLQCPTQWQRTLTSERGKNHGPRRTHLQELKLRLLLGCCLGRRPGSQRLASHIPEGELP